MLSYSAILKSFSTTTDRSGSVRYPRLRITPRKSPAKTFTGANYEYGALIWNGPREPGRASSKSPPGRESRGQV